MFFPFTEIENECLNIITPSYSFKRFNIQPPTPSLSISSSGTQAMWWPFPFSPLNLYSTQFIIFKFRKCLSLYSVSTLNSITFTSKMLSITAMFLFLSICLRFFYSHSKYINSFHKLCGFCNPGWFIIKFWFPNKSV